MAQFCVAILEMFAADLYSGYPMYSILQGIQLEVGQDLIDHVYCINTSMPEHEAVPLSRKICLQIVAVTFIQFGKD